METPRSPYHQIAGLVFLGRTIDKIRLRRDGRLRADFHELMGKGFDARMMAFLGLDYETFARFVSAGATDDECAAYVAQQGRPLNDHLRLIWNDFATKRGWNDAVSGLLSTFKAESGLAHRTDIVTLFQYMDADEGRG